MLTMENAMTRGSRESAFQDPLTGEMSKMTRWIAGVPSRKQGRH